MGIEILWSSPLKILKRVSSVAYQLELPPTMEIHSVMHVSEIKQHNPPQTQVNIDFSSVSDSPIPLMVVLDISAYSSGRGNSYEVGSALGKLKVTLKMNMI
jgi:hypothetical protein